MHRVLIRRGDAGFTLIELLVSVTVLGIVLTGLMSVMFGSLQANTANKIRLDETRDEQFTGVYLAADVQGATTILTGVTAGCGVGSAVLELRGASYDPTTFAASVTVVSYVFSTVPVGTGSVGQLKRQFCETAAAPAPTYPLAVKTTTTVARTLSVTAPTSVCTPAPCGATSRSVTVSLTRRSGEAPFVLVGTRRTST